MVLLVDIADRQDARQDRRPAAEPLDQRLAESPDRAAGRQEHGRIGERQRIGRGKRREAPADERVGERRQERRAGGDGEDARAAWLFRADGCFDHG